MKNTYTIQNIGMRKYVLNFSVALVAVMCSYTHAGIFDDFKYSYLSKRSWAGNKQMHTDFAYLLNIPAYNDVIIAIIDTGISTNNKYLSHVRWWQNPNEIDNGVDDDGNGYIDDGLIGGGYDFGDMDNDPKINYSTPRVDHGTEMAGVILLPYLANSTSDSGNRTEGVFKEAIIMNLKVGMGVNGTYNNLDHAIRYAADNGARVINCSFGSSFPDELEEAVAHAVSKGAIVVASAGNTGGYIDSWKHFPSSFPGVIGVGSALDDYILAGDASFGPDVDFVMYTNVCSLSVSSLGSAGGSSAAAAMMSGVIGRLISFDPSHNLESIMALLKKHAIPFDHIGTGYGRINFKSLAEEFVDIDTTLISTKIKDELTYLEFQQASHGDSFKRTVLRSIYHKNKRYFINLEVDK